MVDHHRHLQQQQQQQQQQFCLRWNNHGSTLVAVFDNLLASESLVDVTLFAEGHLLKAHKVVLSACSPYFQTLFAQTTDKHPIVILKDVKHDELKALLEYMYRGEVNVAQDQLGPLIKTAESLKIKGLADGSSSGSGNNNKVLDGDLRSTHPAGLELPKSDGEGKSGRTTLNSFSLPQVPQVSVPSVLSTVLTMPPALSLASSTLVPPIKLPSLSQSAGTPTDGSSHEDNDSPFLKRRKRMRRKSGETCESGDSDGRSSGSPVGESIHLPRIPATITPVVGPHHHTFHREQQQQREQQLKERERELEREIERERERERDRSLERESDWKRDREQESERDSRALELSEQFRPSSPSPENLVGSSRGSVDIPRSSPSITRSHLEYERSTLSPNKALALLGRPEENSSDANHMSDDEYDYKPSVPVHEPHPDTPGPSTSRPRPDDSHKPGNYLGWPYPPDTSGTSEDSYSALENANQGNDYPQANNTWFESSVCSATLSDPFYSFASPAAAPTPSSSSSSFQQTTSAALGLLTAHSYDSTQSLAEFSFLRNVQGLGATNPYSSAVRNLEFVKALARRAVMLSLQNSAKGLCPPFPPAGRLLQCGNEGTPNGNDSKYLHAEAGPANGGGHASHVNNNNNSSSSSSTSMAHGSEMYTCNRCGKAYGVRRSLYRHQKFECGVEPKFPCPVCDKRCSHKFNLKQHIMSHHKHITTP